MGDIIKTKKGITLIALVITVIIMLILAGVAISVLTANDGLFNKATIAKNTYINSSEYENSIISDLTNIIDRFNTTDKNDSDIDDNKS